MRFLKQIALILLFCISGEIISFLLRKIFPNIFIPGSLLGMLFLFVLLKFNIVKLKTIDSVSTFFLNNMAFFFIPSVVSLLAYFDIIEPILGKLFLILFISFICTFIFVGISAKITLKIMQKVDKNE